jgi:tetratricopeptide (TPR) repeat protein
LRPQLDPCESSGTTKAKFLLTSRRDEEDWLGEVPRRIKVPPMPMQERVQLARALAEKRGHRISEVADWRPLLRFTDGNPLTITVLVGQALRDGLTRKEQIDDFVSKLRAGEAKFDDEASEGRTRSLGASLSYGFDHGFSEQERKQLALLHFFQGFVDVDVLREMGHPETEWCLPEVRGLTREAGIALLDRAAEVGLLTSLGGGYFTIHPAVPWFFKSLFDTYYAGTSAGNPADRLGGDASPAGHPIRAFVEAMGRLGGYYAREHASGHSDVIAVVAAEEANLLHARRLARRNGWWELVISTMAGLSNLYDQTGRRTEWKGLVEEIVPDFVDPATDGPRPGRQDQWSLVTEYRVQLAREMRHWAKGERLQRLCVDWDRRRAEDVLDRHSGQVASPIVADEAEAGGSQRPANPPVKSPSFRDRLAAVLPLLSDVERNAIRTLAVSLHELGQIQRERQEQGCIASYEEALDLAEQIGDRAAAAACAFNLGIAYHEIPAIRDLDQAERGYRRSLELHDERDRLGRGGCQNNLGAVALERFEKARDAGEPDATQLAHLNAALEAYHEALELIPEDAVDDQAVAHNQLGVIYISAGDIDRALSHYRESIRYKESESDTYGAALTRYNVALALVRAGRLLDAREYARAARDGFASYGAAAEAEVQRAQGLIERIDKAIAGKNG